MSDDAAVTITLPQGTWQVVEDVLVSLGSTDPLILAAIAALKGE